MEQAKIRLMKVLKIQRGPRFLSLASKQKDQEANEKRHEDSRVLRKHIWPGATTSKHPLIQNFGLKCMKICPESIHTFKGVQKTLKIGF